jgi:hypothetical protein
MTQNNKLTYYLRFFAFLYVGLVIIGIFNNYSPVPFWDMWNGYLEFYMKVQSGDWYAWFAQHNEHRVFLSRILFWLDIRFFDGASYFLILCNFLLMGGIGYIFYKYIDSLFGSSSDIKKWLAWTIVILSFSWIQNNNITWGFQSQFFLAYLVPLLSFYFLAKYTETNQNKFFGLSVGTGILSVLTMGNGIAALPLLIILGFLLKLSKFRQIFLIIVTIVTLYIYFLDYVAPVGHGSLSNTLLHHTKEFILYILTYLGGPFSKIFGSSKLFIIQFFGIAFILSSLYFTVVAFRKKTNVFIFSLLIFIAYIGVTAFGTAGGRTIFGLKQALESRYMTPQLMGWSALLIIFIYLNYQKSLMVKYIKILFYILPLLFIFQQGRALKYHSNAEQMVASLALELSVHDETFTKQIFPNYEWLVRLAKDPIKQDLSIFSNNLIYDVAMRINSILNDIPKGVFQGSLDEVQPIDGESKYFRVRGWLFDGELISTPTNAYIVDEDDAVVGYILTGFERPDVAKAIHKKALYSGFYGYVLKNVKSKRLFIVDLKLNKKLGVSFEHQ